MGQTVEPIVELALARFKIKIKTPCSMYNNQYSYLLYVSIYVLLPFPYRDRNKCHPQSTKALHAWHELCRLDRARTNLVFVYT